MGGDTLIRLSLKAFLVSATLFAAQEALADSLLEKMEGSWRGQGWIQRQQSGPRETVRCRLDGDFEARLRRIVLQGRCAGGGRSGRIGGNVRDVGVGRFSGTWFGSGLERPLPISGRRDGASIRFTWAAQSETLGEGSMTWRLFDNRLEITNSFVQDGQRASGAIVLEAQGVVSEDAARDRR